MPHDHPFLVVPGDTLWLRSGRPFLAGEDSADAGLFPPTPWTFQGLIRTHVLHAHFGSLEGKTQEAIRQFIGPPDALPAGWSIEGPFPATVHASETVEPWFAWPRFLWLDDERPVRTKVLPKPATAELIAATEQRWTGVPASRASDGSGWISARNLAWALAGWGDWDPRGAHPGGKHSGGALPPFVEAEPRPGVAIERKTGTAQDHMLYVAVHHRFAPGSGLYGALHGADLDVAFASGAHLGRSGRTVSLQPASPLKEWERLRTGNQLELPDVPDPLHVRVVLLTPAIARADGGPPFDLPPGTTVRATEAEAGPDIGGFDRIGHGGRATRATWAAGSTWWVEIQADSGEQRLAIARALQGLAPHQPDDFERFGFGQRIAAPFDPTTGQPLSSKEKLHG